MYVYVDTLLLLNLIMNSIILFITAWVSNIAYVWWRILLSAFCGAIYVLFGVLPQTAVFYSPLAKVAVSVALVLIAFSVKSWKALAFLVGVFYIISFVLGGAVVGWFYFWQSTGLNAKEFALNQVSWTDLAGGSIMGVLFLLLLVRRMKARIDRRHLIFPVILEYGGRKSEAQAMLDTGNRLYTTVGKSPVVLVEQKIAEPVLGPLAVKYLHDNDPENWLANLDQCLDLRWLERIEIIPYQAVGARNLLLGFRLDWLRVMTGNRVITVKNVVVGIYTGILSSDGMYTVLLHPEIVQNVNSERKADVCVLPGRLLN
ncbi:sporulation factor spoiiga [Lucifera butyrica]|uniref:Sporulation factor spoiiga n=1 Tax=Lucifera butyrica TaxID=1351585 RepID=A0A498R456_9FIRM|nr:sigma-E processing peptidase SpoIIGA [Lucifera butyrica]VBB06211.1 sporulation factor spoiiga [Lucifera butyrica]